MEMEKRMKMKMKRGSRVRKQRERGRERRREATLLRKTVRKGTESEVRCDVQREKAEKKEGTTKRQEDK